MDVMKQLSLAGLVPVIKIENAKDAVPLCAALSRGGLPVAEITFRTDAAEESIRRVHGELPDVLLGAGTVLTVDQVDRAVDAGAAYIVSPGLNPAVVERCMEKGVPALPGCANASDIERALSLGIKTVKFFPAEALGGLPMIKALSAPYGDVRFVPTGGVSEKNVRDYLRFPKVAAVGGSWMVPEDALKNGDFARIESLARQAVTLLLSISVGHIGINYDGGDAAMADAKRLAALTGWEIKDGERGMFVGDGFELMKMGGRGEKGHIALETDDVERAMYHMTRRGFRFDENSIAGQGGRLTLAYLEGEIGGFAIHLRAR